MAVWLNYQDLYAVSNETDYSKFQILNITVSNSGVAKGVSTVI